MAESRSTCSWVSMPNEQAIWISTSLRIASMPAATWASSRSSGPRTAATMQNSVAPVLAVCLAASTRLGMSSHALRTGDAKSPDCEQKWQSSGQPPVVRLLQHPHGLFLVQALAALQYLLASLRQNVAHPVALHRFLNGVQVRVP